ncbi:MAG: hypothetical protein IT529_08100 [Burkholderiales bacterium]|nr:hypothetical protein [Burkholderiales bacterium]
MSDKPVLGNLGRVLPEGAQLLEIRGQLKQEEWAEFIECVRQCARKYGGKILVESKEIQVPRSR